VVNVTLEAREGQPYGEFVGRGFEKILKET
jgi:hypothetical protein